MLKERLIFELFEMKGIKTVGNAYNEQSKVVLKLSGSFAFNREISINYSRLEVGK